MKNFFFWLLLTIGVYVSLSMLPAKDIDPPFYSNKAKQWADSVFKTLTTDEKIGQLFMAAAWSGGEHYNKSEIDSLISIQKIGGICFFQGGPYRQAVLTNQFQKDSKVPLMIGIDGEWGLNMRLDSTIRFPRQMTLGALQDESLIYEMGAEIARQCKAMGIHVNFAPCIDINNNPLNPIINSRSFGENKIDVARKGLYYMRALQDHNVLACGKHFPGHGNTESDSHFTLPVINQPAHEIDTVELYPFKHLMREGLGSVMVAHLNIPALDSGNNIPSTLSSKIINGLLKDKLKFKGLVFTDALNMKGVTANFPSGEIEVRALEAGNDILLLSGDIPLAVIKIKDAFATGRLDSNQVYKSVKKILMAKHWCGLDKVKPIDQTKIFSTLNDNINVNELTNSLYYKSITLLRNDESKIPLHIDNTRRASLVVNDTINNYFQQSLSYYSSCDNFALKQELSNPDFDSLINKLATYQEVILSFHNTSIRSNLNFNITPQMTQVITALSNRTDLIVVVFGNLYTLNVLSGINNCKTILLSYEDTYLPAVYTAQALFGALNTMGKLPARPNPDFNLYTGLQTTMASNILTLSPPCELKLNNATLANIDSLALECINNKVFPGCAVVVAYKGNVIYNKSFGHYTYEAGSLPVTSQSLFDIASVTKMTSTALAVMKLYDEGKIDLKQRMSFYVPELRKSNKIDLLVEDILTHQAGLKSWIPFYQQTIDAKGRYINGIYSKTKSAAFSIPVADSIYMNPKYLNTITKEILMSPLGKRGQYVYSDLSLILTQRMVENITGMPLNKYVEDNFYKPMGLTRITYNPLDKFGKGQIVPTENDTGWRKQLVQGHVHDMAAAMLGGVSGHAGVFANGYSLAVIMQMLMQGGKYGNYTYMRSETVDFFTAKYFKDSNNRRGLIFDKPDKGTNSPTCDAASSKTFGHTGFTGTCAWADPEKQLVFIFLSNRVHPNAANNKLVTQNIRTRMMKFAYDAITL
ncbi:MAG: serine hydrolase [Bacteroidetes bacterium]|nr:serine hydrolase [Bacteroidota bacterium]